MMDQLLRFYFEIVLKLFSYLPIPICYLPLKWTGHWFRDWRTYSCATASAGVLFNAIRNIQNLMGISQKKATAIISTFLSFESRYVLENNWLKNHNEAYILSSFTTKAKRELQSKLINKQTVICTLHSANLFTMGALIHSMQIPLSFMVAIIPESMPDGTNPLHENGIRMLMKWQKWQSLIPANMQAARAALKDGNSIVMAVDTPGYKDRGVIVNLFNQQIWVPVGAAKLAQEFNLPIIVAIPWASSVTSLYEVDIEVIDTSGTPHKVMQQIFLAAEKTILKNPACWMGWLCLEQMPVS